MISSIFLVCIVLVPAACSFLVARRAERFLLCAVLGLSATVFLTVLWLVNDAIPYSGSGDDKDYFDASIVRFNELSDWVDFGQFSRTHEQAGFPMLLAWVHQVAGGSLYHRKALNVFFFLLLALIWFVIGKSIGGRRLAFVFAVGILSATPLWYYWIFLLKDMSVILLQSVFLLGLVLFLSRNARGRGYSLIVLSTILIIPFRSMLALVNVAALCGALLLQSGTRRKVSGLMWKTVLAGSVVAVVMIVGTNPGALRSLGVGGEHRALDRQSVQTSVEISERRRPAYFGNPLKFSIVYLMGEVAAFNPKSWVGMNASLIRAISMVPWIFAGAPLFVAGVAMIIRRKRVTKTQTDVEINRRGSIHLSYLTNERPYMLLLFTFVLIYAGVAWLSGDTTRWRMPSIPPMVAIAGFAWVNMSRTKRFGIVFGWALALSVALLTYYAIIK